MLRMLKDQSGIGLIEILTALALTGMLTGAIYSVYILQNRCFTIQNEVVEMNQNLRAGMFMMERELRMAGYDPTAKIDPPGAGAGIVIANGDSVEFTADLDGDGDTDEDNEHVTYSLFDANGDGINDLGRDASDGNGDQAVAENVDALDLVYLDENDAETAITDDIRSIQVTLVVRTGRLDPNFTNSTTYQNQLGETIYTAPDDNYRRKALNTQIRCRNLGL